jgi:integrase
MTIPELLAETDRHCQASTRKRDEMSESYARLTKSYMERFCNTIQDVTLTDIPALKRALKNYLSRNVWNTSTRRLIAHAITAVLVDSYLISEAEASEITNRFPAPRSDWSTKALSSDEQRELLNSIRTRIPSKAPHGDWLPYFSRIRDYCLTATMLLSGIRGSQAIGITKWELTHSSIVIYVMRQKNKISELRAKEIPLTVQLPDLTRFADMINLYLTVRQKRCPRSEYLFPDKLGGSLHANYLRNFFNRYAPFPMHPHRLRHTAGTVIARKVGVPQAAALLDHTSIQTTMRYIDTAQISTKDTITEGWN